MSNLRPFKLISVALLEPLKYTCFIKKTTKSVEKSHRQKFRINIIYPEIYLLVLSQQHICHLLKSKLGQDKSLINNLYFKKKSRSKSDNWFKSYRVLSESRAIFPTVFSFSSSASNFSKPKNSLHRSCLNNLNLKKDHQNRKSLQKVIEFQQGKVLDKVKFSHCVS
jgi:hypothetical protein